MKKTKQLEHYLMLQKASDILNLSQAHYNLNDANQTKYKASGVIVEVKDLTGKTIVQPFTVSDGLSQDTIEALRADVKRTYDVRLLHSKI